MAPARALLFVGYEPEQSARSPPQFEAALRGDPALAALIARTLLDPESPESLHADICTMAGLDVDALEVDAARSRVTELVTRRRDPQFRERVLVAYEYRCAMCGFDGTLGRDAVGLYAAHVRWWASRVRTWSTTLIACVCSITSCSTARDRRRS